MFQCYWQDVEFSCGIDFDMVAEQEVRNAMGPEDLRAALATLESSIHEEYLSPLFNRKPLLVKGAWLPTGTSWNLILSLTRHTDIKLSKAVLEHLQVEHIGRS